MLIPFSEIIIAVAFKMNIGSAETALNLPNAERLDLLVVDEKELTLSGRNAVTRTVDNRQFIWNGSPDEDIHSIEALVLMFNPIPRSVCIGFGETDPILAFSTKGTMLVETLDLLVSLQKLLSLCFGRTTSRGVQCP